MTAIKRCCALALAVLMILTALPVTAFAETAAHETNASLHETTLDGIANDITRQVLRSSQKDGERIQMENTAKLDDSDEVEIIVVVNDSVADPDSRAQVNALLRTQKSALSQIERALDTKVEPQRQYTTLLNGFSATVTYGQYKAIRRLDCVQSAFISPTFELLPDTANSNKMIGGGSYNTTGFTGEGMLVAILDTGVDMGHEVFKAAPKSPSLTQEKLRTLLETYDFQVENIIKGISVSNLYYSAKIPFQFDYGDKDKDGNPGEKGSHGTHVASTAAGNVGVNDAVMGVAPQAQIINMNVFKSSGGASYSDILAALEDCILLGVDVANLSLGSDCGYIDYDSEDAFTKSLLDVFERTGESGVSLAVAAGNAYNAAYGDAFGGKALASNPDYGLVSEPSTYGESLSVAAVSNGVVNSPYVTVGGKNLAYQDSATISDDENAKPFRSLSSRGSIEYVVVPNYGAEEDYAGLDLTGKIALVQRGGGMYYEQKERAAANAGAIGMLVYNNVPGMLYMSITDWKIPCAFISQAAGEYMKQQQTKTLSVAAADALVESPTYGMADFSSWGATTELTLKPELTAPGAGIYAAVPGGYESMDGTSMASPHVAGGMAIVQQALKARDASMSGADRKHMTDTLLMSTAHVIYDNDGVPYSPRKQGAGLMSINDAVNTRGYLSVAGMERPKLELKDDPAMKGVYTMTFTVHNTGSDTLYYDVTPIVLTDTTESYVNGNQQEFSTISGSSRLLPHTFTTNCENNRVSVAPGKTADVTVTVTVTDEGRTMLAQFPNGGYVEGFVTLTQVAADGSSLTDPIDLGVPFLAFYGDWTKAPIMDSTDYWETLDGSASQAQAYMNTAFSSSSENTVDTYLGDNNYTSVPYLADRNAISPNNDDFMDSLTGIYTGLLRNTKSLKYTITGANGQVYYSKDCEYVGKSIYSYDYYRIVPAGVDAEYDGIEPWYGTDSHNAKLPNNTKATVTIEATLPYGDGVGTNQKSSWSFPITIDTEEPHADNLKVTESEGRYYLSLDVSDNQYVAAVVFYNVANTQMLYGMQGFGELQPGVTSHVSEYDITGFGETFGMIVHDYAGNSKVYTVTAKGNPDDHGTITPTNILWTENFNEKWLPDDWSVQSKGGSLNTWYRDEDYMAAVDHDDDNQQNEWLISRTTDISGVDTEVHMVFDFYTTYWYTVEYKHCNLQVMASGDGGENWQEIWNLQRDSGLFTAWTKTQAKVNIPESLQNSKDLRFAFVYTGKGGSDLSLDNVQLYAEERDNYVAVTATAGEGGTITPAGQTLVKKGTSKTFDIAPAQGYEIVNVNVDGTDLGPISYYTFQRVGVDHTISATFQKAQPSGDTVTLTTTASDGGTVAPAGQTTYVSGQAVDVTFTPDQGYQLASVKVNGRTASVTGNVLTLTMDQSYAVSAVFEKIPDVPTVMFENDFESVTGDSFPFHGWTLKGVNPNGYTWKQYTYYNWKSLGNDTKHAYISDDWNGGPQDEWLISPSVNLSGTRDGVLYFDYAYGIYGIKNKTFTATVEASTDGGQTWTPIWNFQDSYTGQETSGYALAGSAEAKVPAQYAVDGVQFAFRYVNTTHDTAPLAVDNVKLMAVEDGPVAQKYTITAAAGEGGSITPAGEVSVKEGASQTFTITASEGYAIADVLVDGQSVGAVDSYTFENVTANHTIAVVFTRTASDVQFDNDFESETFPGHGWTVKGTRTDSPYTWYKGTNTKLNSTKQARIDMDYYEDTWGDWSVGGIRKPLLPMAGGSDKLQDEYLISPVVDLTGKTPTLNFDYLLFKYVIGRYCSVTVEATTDGGRTWTTIWNAADLGEISGYWYNGTAHVAVPAAFCTDNAQFAFHFYKKANQVYEYTDAMFAIDNVTMTFGQTDPCADGHTLTAVPEVPATCETAGTKAYWECSVCRKLFSDADGKNETTLEALTIPATGHAWGQPAWTWTGTESASAVFTCGNDVSHTQTLTAAVTSQVTTEPGCESTGVRTYTATVTFEGQTYTDTKTETLPATGHVWGQPVWQWTGFAAQAVFACARDAGHTQTLTAAVTSQVTTEPGCESTGVRTYTATVTLEGRTYTDTKTETLPATGHDTQLVGAKDATCTQDGYTGDEVCKTCGVTVKKGEVIPATGHDTQLVGAKPATCTEDGYTGDEVCKTCGVTVKKGEVIPATGHDTQLVGAKPATCTQDGYTGDEVCKTCGVTVKKGEVIPATGHDTQLVGAKPATCTEDGYTGDEVCKTCGETVKKGEVIPATGHDTEIVGAKAATCTEDGYTGDEVCKTCGVTVKKGEVIPATGHDTQLVGAKDATCTQDGYTGDEVCKTCGETVTKGEVVKATGHQYKDGKCTVCGEKDPNYQPAQPGVKTGDASSVTLWVMLLTVSALLAAAVVVLPRRKHTR